MARLTPAARRNVTEASGAALSASAGEPLTELEFFVEAKPVPKGRPRVVGRGRNRHTYTPRKTLEFEEKVRMAALEAATTGKMFHPGAAVYFRMDVLEHGILVRLYDDRGKRRPQRFDLDNVVKAVLDGIQQRKDKRGVIHDDRQVTAIFALGRAVGPAPQRRDR